MHVIEYDGKSLLSYNQDKYLDTAHPQAPMGSHEYSNSIQQISIPSLPLPVHTGQPSLDTGATVGGIHLNHSNKRKRLMQLFFWFTLFFEPTSCLSFAVIFSCFFFLELFLHFVQLHPPPMILTSQKVDRCDHYPNLPSPLLKTDRS